MACSDRQSRGELPQQLRSRGLPLNQMECEKSDNSLVWKSSFGFHVVLKRAILHQ
jgi:hypothetical protein